MKKLVIISTILTISTSAFAGPNTSIANGDWSDNTIWSAQEAPYVDATAFDHVNIGSNTSVTVSTIEEYDKNIWTKGGSSLIFVDGGTLNYSSQMSMDGGKLVFMGGHFVPSGFVNQSSSSEGYVFGSFDQYGDFYAAVAKSMNSSSRLQLISGTKAVYNLGVSNLISSKVAGLDDNALFYTTGEFQVMQGDIYLDFSNITAKALAENGITEAGTYYVALMSWGRTFKDIGASDFSPVLAEGSAVETDFVKFAGFEWGNGTSQGNNTLYAVLNVNPVIPEPSTYATIFGALALAFVAYRHRK